MKYNCCIELSQTVHIRVDRRRHVPLFILDGLGQHSLSVAVWLLQIPDTTARVWHWQPYASPSFLEVIEVVGDIVPMQIMNGLWWCWTMMSPRSRGRVASCLTRRTNGLAGSCLTEKPMSNHSRTPMCVVCLRARPPNAHPLAPWHRRHQMLLGLVSDLFPLCRPHGWGEGSRRAIRRSCSRSSPRLPARPLILIGDDSRNGMG